MFSIKNTLILKVCCRLPLVFIVVGLVLSACTLQSKAPTTGPVIGLPGSSTQLPTPALTTLPASTVTAEPSPTPEALALQVNGAGISLVEYQASLSQLEEANAGQNKQSTPEQDRQQVLNSLSDSLLMAQAAFQNGFTLDDAALDARVSDLSAEMGGDAVMRSWQAKYGYDTNSFRAALRREMAAAWQRDQIAATVPEEAEQIYARQILVYDQSMADQILQRVKTPGTIFASIAFGYDPQIGGDLGWFPRGYLLQPEVEEAAFALQPGEISPVIHSQVGYHILQVIAREQRPLSPDARRVLQHNAVENWLRDQRAKNQVEILLP